MTRSAPTTRRRSWLSLMALRQLRTVTSTNSISASWSTTRMSLRHIRSTSRLLSVKTSQQRCSTPELRCPSLGTSWRLRTSPAVHLHQILLTMKRQTSQHSRRIVDLAVALLLQQKLPSARARQESNFLLASLKRQWMMQIALRQSWMGSMVSCRMLKSSIVFSRTSMLTTRFPANFHEQKTSRRQSLLRSRF